MRYIGGKSKLAKQIAATILDQTPERGIYIEPFIGGGSVFGQVAPHFAVALAADIVPDLAMMWQQTFEGSFTPPEIVTEAEYAVLRSAKPSALRGFVGFGGSFGGKWFGGYARGGYQANGDPRNHQGESARAVKRIADRVAKSDVGVDVICTDYRTLHPQPGDVVYCDPPYAGTEGFSAAGVFDSTEFWSTMERWSAEGAIVFVSEYTAPDGWHAIWQSPHRQSLTMPIQGRELTTEKLFRMIG